MIVPKKKGDKNGEKKKETIVDGIDNATAAFLGLFKGKNLGKMIVRVGPDPAD
jgi:NADPH-dependent curcumin reductase CurA